MRALDPRLLERTRSARPLLVLDTALGLAVVVPVVAQAVLLARIVARAFGGAGLAAVRLDLVLLALAFAGRGVLVWGMTVAGRRAASSVLSELRMALVARRLLAGRAGGGGGSGSASASGDAVESAEIATTAVQGVDALEAYFGRYLPQLVLAAVVPPAIVVFVATVDLEAALIMLVTLPLVPVFMWLIGRSTEQRTRERWEALQLLSADFLDLVRGLPTLRACGRARAQEARIAAVGERYRRATLGTLRVAFLSGSVLELAATIGVALVAVTAGVRLVGGSLGLQAGMTVLVLAPELYLPLRRLGAEYHASADGLAVAERMFTLIDEAPAAVPPAPARESCPVPDPATVPAAVADARESRPVPEPATVPVAVADPRDSRSAPDPATVPVRFEDVSFAYPGRPVAVLRGLDLELPPGETVVLTGKSGAGKSTVAALLLRLRDPSAGRITVGGADLAGVEAVDWWQRLAWVPQAPTLLRGTIADNIRLGIPAAAASGERIRAAATLAGADPFVRRLPDGYATVVGDGGRPVSPGERRRIALARAFLRDAPLVILDEPTADLDAASVALVGDALERLRVGRTVLLIAHRPEVVRLADRVVHLQHGRVRGAPLREAA